MKNVHREPHCFAEKVYELFQVAAIFHFAAKRFFVCGFNVVRTYK